jgi:hypothetical protein
VSNTLVRAKKKKEEKKRKKKEKIQEEIICMSASWMLQCLWA